MDVLKDVSDFVSERFLFGYEAPGADVPLFESGVMDSTGALEVVQFIHKRYGLEVPDDDLVPVHFATLRRIADYVTQRLTDLPV